jgi:uncharacterized BrkB/YihY/UPF0761 family membrane protein
MSSVSRFFWHAGMALWHLFMAGRINRLGTHASSCTYFFLISSVPFIILAGWFAAEMFEGSKAQQLLEVFPLYLELKGFAGSMGAKVSGISFKAVGVFGVLYALWSASKLIRGLAYAFGLIFYAPGKRKRIFIAISSYIFIPALMVAAILISLMSSVLGRLTYWFFSQTLHIMTGQTVALLYTTVVPVGFVVLAAYSCYMVLSPAKPLKRSAFFAALAFGIYFYVLQKIMLALMEGMLRSYAVYGALGTLLLILLWAYLIFYGLFFMAELASMAEKFRELTRRRFYYVSFLKEPTLPDKFLMLQLPFGRQEYLTEIKAGERLSLESMRAIKIFSGKVNILRETRAQTMGEGEGLYLNNPAGSTAEAVEDSKVLLLEQKEMNQLIKQYPEVWDILHEVK